MTSVRVMEPVWNRIHMGRVMGAVITRKSRNTVSFSCPASSGIPAATLSSVTACASASSSPPTLVGARDFSTSRALADRNRKMLPSEASEESAGAGSAGEGAGAGVNVAVASAGLSSSSCMFGISASFWLCTGWGTAPSEETQSGVVDLRSRASSGTGDKLRGAGCP